MAALCVPSAPSSLFTCCTPTPCHSPLPFSLPLSLTSALSLLPLSLIPTLSLLPLSLTSVLSLLPLSLTLTLSLLPLSPILTLTPFPFTYPCSSTHQLSPSRSSLYLVSILMPGCLQRQNLAAGHPGQLGVWEEAGHSEVVLPGNLPPLWS